MQPSEPQLLDGGMVIRSIFRVGKLVKRFFASYSWINLRNCKADLMVRLAVRNIWSDVMKHGSMYLLKNGYIGLYTLWNL